MHTVRTHGRESERGFMVLIAMLACVLPLVVILGATSMANTSRQSRLSAEIDDEMALMAAEAGVDYAAYRASTAAGLTSGATYTRDLGDGMTFSARPVFLRTDGVNNDGDAQTDEADENIFSVTVTGSYRGVQRRVVAYLGPQTSVPPVYGAMSIKSAAQLQVQDSARISGVDRNMNGTLGPGPSLHGVASEPPTSIATMLSWIDNSEEFRLQGVTAAPSATQATQVLDWTALKTQIQNSANLVLTSDTYQNYNFGSGATNNWKTIYRGGNVQFQLTSRGAGIMFVDGDFKAQEDFRFDGLIYVTGKVIMQGNSIVYGGVSVKQSQQIQLQVNAKIYYSTQAITGASTVLPGKYVLFNGWQEIERN